MNSDERDFVGFALEVLASGGNGEGWNIGDAIAALRVALGEDEAGGNWTAPVDVNERKRLVAFVGKHSLPAPDLSEGDG